MADPIITPFVIIIDTREQHPYAFGDLTADARDGYAPLRVQTERRGLRSGDYSLRGHEDAIAVERKSLADLYGTLGQHRDRFEAEIARLAEMQWAVVMIEANWTEILAGIPRSELNPKTVHRTVIAWSQRYPRVAWWPMECRRLAEVTTFRVLERWWRDHQK